MVCGASGDGELNHFLRSSHAAPSTFNSCSDAGEVCESLHEIIIQNISNCEYYDIDCRLVNGNSDDALIPLHVNIRSLQKNFDPLCELITLLNFTPQIICITETRIKDQPLINVAIPNYSFVHANSTSNAGGVAVYFHCSLKIYSLSPTILLK